MNIIKIKALKTEDYITVGLHSRGVCMLVCVCVCVCVSEWVCVKGYQSRLQVP